MLLLSFNATLTAKNVIDSISPTRLYIAGQDTMACYDLNALREIAFKLEVGAWYKEQNKALANKIEIQDSLIIEQRSQIKIQAQSIESAKTEMRRTKQRSRLGIWLMAAISALSIGAYIAK